MDFDIQWLLFGLPVAFGLGWLASRWDLRQWRRDQRDSPNTYFKGLALLLNEQHDKAIDAFMEAIKADPDTSDLHFALGSLFRRRGEFERAVRVHQHLLSRGDLTPADRDRAQHGLAQDFLAAGLFDRAEEAWAALRGTAFDTDARLALLTLHERSRNWPAAIDGAVQLERTSGTGSYQPRIAHYWCEIAAEADALGRTADADDAMRHATAAAPQAGRPWWQKGTRSRAAGRHADAVAAWDQLQSLHPELFGLVAYDYATSALAAGAGAEALGRLATLRRETPSPDLVRALDVLDPDAARRRDRWAAELRRHPSLSSARALLQSRRDVVVAVDHASPDTADLDAADLDVVDSALQRAAAPLQRYRCAACGFEAQRYFWQCPGCLHWDSYPPQRLDEA